MLHKNTGLTALDLSGLMLPPGAVADVDPTDPVPAEHIADGRLTAVHGELVLVGELGPELVIATGPKTVPWVVCTPPKSAPPEES